MDFKARAKGYHLWCLEAKKMIISRDVTFDDSAMLNKVSLEKLNYTSMQVEFEQIVVTPR